MANSLNKDSESSIILKFEVNLEEIEQSLVKYSNVQAVNLYCLDTIL